MCHDAITFPTRAAPDKEIKKKSGKTERGVVGKLLREGEERGMEGAVEGGHKEMLSWERAEEQYPCRDAGLSRDSGSI